MHIRDEKHGDEAVIFDLTQAAFAPMPYSSGTEGPIINALRRDGDLTLSRVAIEGDEIIGHIAFSPVTIKRAKAPWFALGPVSVQPDKQGRGVGSALIHDGLEQLKSLSANGCVLVGNPAYYGRFGFKNDGRISYGDVPSEFVQWLSFEGDMPSGEIRYSPAFEAE
ncbi:MAG: GNAT family N-acetyltransferase [Maricaulaceae bacterium]